MKRIIITESERKNILKSHGVILEQTAAEMLAAIQTAINTNPDKKIGPDTTSKLVSALQGVSTTSGFDWTCVKSNKNKKPITVFDDTKEETVFKGYQIGDLVFEKSGNYYESNNESTKFKYSCDGNMIVTDNHGKISDTEVKKDNTESIKNFIANYEDEHTPQEISKSLLKKYTKEEIIKANPSYESVLNQSTTTDKSVNKNDKKVQSKIEGEDETLADESNLFNIGSQPDK